MKTSYKGFKVGNNVILNNCIVCERKHFDNGHNFKIVSFPYCTIPSKFQNFVFGKDKDDNIIRCFVNEISKNKK